MTLYLSQKKLLLLLVFALVIGFCLGFLYDGIRLLRSLRKPEKKTFRFLNACLISLEDFLFFVFGGVVMSILFYVMNSGKVRPLAFVMAVLGFSLFRRTLGKVTFPLLLRLLWIFGFPFRLFRQLLRQLVARWRLIVAKRATKRFFKKILRLGEQGYLDGIRRL